MQRDIDRLRPMGFGVASRLRSPLVILLLAFTMFWAAPAAAQVTLPSGQAGMPYAPVTLTNPAGAITGVQPFAVPFGMDLDTASGILDGTPLDFGNISIDVTFGGATVVTYTFTLAPPDLVLDPTPLPAAMVGRPYGVTRAISGTGSGFSTVCTCVVDIVPAQPGGPPYFFPQLGIDHDPVSGLFSGTPTDVATLSIEAHAFDGGIWDYNAGVPFEGPTVNYSLVITPALALVPSTLADGIEGTAYNQPIPAPTGGSGPYGFIAIGTLPAGIAVDPATGAFTGTPAAGTAGFYNVQVKATDANGYEITAGPYNLTINIADAALPPTTFPTATRDAAYSQQINAATGGREPFTYAHTSGALPAGITFDPATRTVGGTPTETGTFSFEIAARDALLTLVTQTYELVVVAPGLALPPTPLPGGSVGSAYSQTLNSATGGTAPFSYAVTAGALPVGVVLTTDGQVVGTPIAEGTANFTVTVTDAANVTASQTYEIVVTVPALALPATILPGGTVLTDYNQSIAPATGGTAPYIYAVTGGSLPDGITMDGTGLLAGTPTASGVFTFTVTATDAAARTAQQSYTLAIAMLPDPRTADLLDLIKWQHHAAAFMANDQNDNIQERFDQIHNGNGSNTGVVIVDPSGSAYLPKVQHAAGSAIDAALDTALPENVGIWTAGRLTVGTIDQAPVIDFTASSLTVGWDMRVSEMLTLGLAGGFGSDRGVIGANGTTGDALGKYVAAYASLQPGEHAFIDAALGAGVLDYDTHRFDPITGGFATGHRDGTQVFGSLSAGADGEVGNVSLSGYAQIEGSFARLGAYTETGGIGALTFATQDVWALAGVIGARAGYSFHLEWGDVTPSVRVEYRHGSYGARDSSVNYAGLLNLPGFGLSGSLAAENAAIVGLQTAVAFDGGLALTLGYDARIGTSGTVSHTVKGVIGGSF